MIQTTDAAITDPAFNNGRPITYANRRRFTLPAGTVLPVTLESRVSSKNSRVGDLVRARISDFNLGNVSYDQGDFDFPAGTMVEGRITSAVAKNGDRPGLVEMNFGRIVLPDGKTTNIDGSLIALDNKNVERNDNGVLVAKNTSKDNRMIYAGYGAGAGLLVGLLTKGPLEKVAIGGILGYLAGTIEQSQRRANDVTLDPGTRFGIRLNNQTAVNIPIDRQR
jgi:hypothetical protein